MAPKNPRKRGASQSTAIPKPKRVKKTVDKENLQAAKDEVYYSLRDCVC